MRGAGAVAIAGLEKEDRYELTDRETSEAEAWFHKLDLKRLEEDEKRAQDRYDYDELARDVEKELAAGQSSLQMFLRVMSPVCMSSSPPAGEKMSQLLCC